jgi:hypothetical protein
LLENENFDTRDFTIFISHKKWVNTILRPLLELCAKEDSSLAMNICSLALILIKKISDKTMKKYKQLKSSSRPKKPQGSNSLSENIENVNNQANLENDSENEEDREEDLKVMSENLKEQQAALLSFKEALCSGMYTKDNPSCYLLIVSLSCREM